VAPDDSGSRATFALLLLCFFFSGFSALVYETAWTRELAAVFGTSDLAVAAVLAAYMGGLAAGSALAARVAPRIRRPVLAYGVLELGIALCAVAVGLATAFRLGTAFALLLPPTALMGATLPLLARHAVRRDSEVGPRIGALYATNTAGAIGGTLCAAFLLLPALGLRQTVYVGAAVNALVFAGAALLARTGSPAPPPGEVVPGARRARWILLAMAFSGGASFVYEVMWTRLLSQLLGGSVYAFATMLASFLLGIALGSAAAGRLARDAARATTGFAWAQLGVAVLSLAAFAAADHLPVLARALGARGMAGAPLGNAALAAAVLLPFAICIGATFPFAVRIAVDRPERSAAASARVYAWNTLGSIAGSIGAGFLLLPRLGFLGTLLFGCAINLTLAGWASLSSRPHRRAPLLAAAATALLLAAGPVDTPWRLLRSSPLSGQPGQGELRYFAVGRSSTVLLLDHDAEWKLLTNGLPESTIGRPGALPARFVEARWLGFLPVLLRPAGERALLIGLGGGIALEGMPASLARVDVVELEPEVLSANLAIAGERELDPLAAPRVRMLTNDARGALALSETRYDAVVSQPSHPWTAGASHLYTREFFELVKGRLDEGGVFVQWIGIGFVDEDLLRTLVATLVDVFEHVQVYRPVAPALLFAASDRPFDLPESAAEALRRVGPDLARYGLHDPEDAVAALLLDESGARAFAAGADHNTDDHNRLAAHSARLGPGRALSPAQLNRLVAELDPLPGLAGRLDPARLIRRLARGRALERATRLARSLPELPRALGLGWIATAGHRRRAAASHFERALALDPGSLEAHAGLFELGAPGEREGAPAAVALLRRARERLADGDLGELAALDPRLAAIPPGSPLFRSAALMRARWRLEAGGTQRAAQALAIVDVVIARGTTLDDHLLRARAALAAKRPDAARAALVHVAKRIAPSARIFAREALELARALPAADGNQALRARLERVAR
jgi:spermidine synthase